MLSTAPDAHEDFAQEAVAVIYVLRLPVLAVPLAFARDPARRDVVDNQFPPLFFFLFDKSRCHINFLSSVALRTYNIGTGWQIIGYGSSPCRIYLAGRPPYLTSM